MRSLGIYLRVLSLDDVKEPINKTRLKIAVLKWHQGLPGANELAPMLFTDAYLLYNEIKDPKWHRTTAKRHSKFPTVGDLLELASSLMFHAMLFMMTSSNGNIFCATGPLCGEFTGHQWIPLTKASLMFSLICTWINDIWINNRDAGDLRHRRAQYDVTVMLLD